MSQFSQQVIERIRENLFATQQEMADAGLTEQEQKRLLELREIYQYWITYPTIRERDILEEMEKRFELTRQQAYKYMSVLRVLIGDLGKTSKDYMRWLFNQRILDMYDKANKDGNVEAAIKALGQFAKYNQLDKEDIVANRWETLKPQMFIMTDDPSVIGFKPIANIREKIKAKIAQYSNDLIEDIRFVESDSVRQIANE